MLEAGIALNTQSIQETQAIFKIVEKEIQEDKEPNVASFSNKLQTNNTFNPDPSST